MRGYEYWKRTFFLSDGTPRYYNHKTLPLDIQCCSQAIDTFVFFSDRDPESLPLAAKGRAMDHQEYARPQRLLLLSPLFAVAGEQNTHAPLGTSDDALRARRTLQNSFSNDRRLV